MASPARHAPPGSCWRSPRRRSARRRCRRGDRASGTCVVVDVAGEARRVAPGRAPRRARGRRRRPGRCRRSVAANGTPRRAAGRQRVEQVEHAFPRVDPAVIEQPHRAGGARARRPSAGRNRVGVDRAGHDGEARRVRAEPLARPRRRRSRSRSAARRRGRARASWRAGGSRSRSRPSGRRRPGSRRRSGTPSRRDGQQRRPAAGIAVLRVQHVERRRARARPAIASTMASTSRSKSPPSCSPSCSRPITARPAPAAAGRRHRRAVPKASPRYWLIMVTSWPARDELAQQVDAHRRSCRRSPGRSGG